MQTLCRHDADMVSSKHTSTASDIKLQTERSRARLDVARHLLSDSYGYPRDWFPSRWRCEEYGWGIQFSICTEEGGAVLVGIVAHEPSSATVNLLKQAIEAEEPLCSLGIIIDGQALSVYRYKSKDSDLIAVEHLEPYKSLDTSARPNVLVRSGATTYDRTSELIPLTHTVESLFFEAHSHIRDIDGLHADEALDELCKVIYTKLFDEEHTSPSEPFKVQYAVYGNTAELSTCLRELYKRANEYDKRVYSLRIPGYKRSRGVFDEPIKLSAPALARVVEEFQRYDISGSELDVKGRAFQRVFLPALRAGMGQYFTPHNVVKFIVESVAPTTKQLVLDPFCGSGHFLTEAMDYVRQHDSSRKSDDFAYHKLHGIEKSERMVRVAMTDMRLHGDGHANIRCTDALLPFANYHDLERESFDLILTNPPFGSVLGVDAIRSLGEFEILGNRKKIPMELLGLERSLAFLRPGGLLAIVLPESVFANSSARYVRDWIASKAQVRAVISLPIETFTPFGANIKTSILFCQKSGSKLSQTPHVFCGVIDNIGHDAAGRPLEGSDHLELSLQLREALC